MQHSSNTLFVPTAVREFQAIMRVVPLLLFLCVYSLAGAQGRHVSMGDVSIPCKGGCSAAQMDSMLSQSPVWSCADSATADLAARWQLPQYPQSWRASDASERKWGPHLNLYQPVIASQVPARCNSATWAQQRLLRVVTDTIALQINYCHHHAPAYNTPASVHQQCDPTEPGEDDDGCVCNSAGMYKANPWKGLDCSNFVAFVYNFAFGFYPTSNIGEQACHPSKAPGRLLKDVTTSKLDQLRAGDLAFITLGRKDRSPPVRVSHVVLWTGWTVDFSNSGSTLSEAALMANAPDYQKAGVERCMREKQAAGQPVYVIADSHNNGPELRPFCGWYISSFSHARRLIEPSSSLPTNDASIAFWDEGSRTCKSNWALQG